ncbi:hypothetical protein HDU76_004905, partial [Blyttiomyces sp. JEL0837]
MEGWVERREGRRGNRAIYEERENLKPGVDVGDCEFSGFEGFRDGDYDEEDEDEENGWVDMDFDGWDADNLFFNQRFGNEEEDVISLNPVKLRVIDTEHVLCEIQKYVNVLFHKKADGGGGKGKLTWN